MPTLVSRDLHPAWRANAYSTNDLRGSPSRSKGPRSIPSAPRQYTMLPLTRFGMAVPANLPPDLPRTPLARKSSQVKLTRTPGNKNGGLAKRKEDNDHNGIVLKDNSNPPNKTLSISAVPALPDLLAPFPGSTESVIHLTLFGEVITCDLKTLGSDAAIIIELLKVTQSKIGSYMTVAAYYRRSGRPHNAKSVLECLLEESSKRGVSDSDLKPVFLLLSSCEVDLAKLSKTEKEGAGVVSAHYASAAMWLQKVFGKFYNNKSEDDKENRPPGPVVEDKRIAQKVTTPSNVAPDSAKELGHLEREIRSLRDRNVQQADQLAQLRSSKRKIEDDYYYERNLRRKYQSRVEGLQEERDAARRMERFALEQVKHEVSKRKLGS